MPLISLHMLRVKTKGAEPNFEVHSGKKLELSRLIMRITFEGCNNATVCSLRKNRLVTKCKYILLYFSQLNSYVP
jgi:hypothetical protein